MSKILRYDKVCYLCFNLFKVAYRSSKGFGSAKHYLSKEDDMTLVPASQSDKTSQSHHSIIQANNKIRNPTPGRAFKVK